MEKITQIIGGLTGITEWIMLFLIIGGGLFLVVSSKLLPYRFIKHAIEVVAGKYDKASDSGEVSHFQALASVVAATVGLGNISGVAICYILWRAWSRILDVAYCNNRRVY